jgi:small subunit ribosomal protein S16
MVVLRMKRMGRSHRPFYRLGAMDKRSQRDGRMIEQLGWYDPVGPADKQINLDVERISYWLSVGAQPSETVANLLKKAGVDVKVGKRKAASKAASKA